MSYPPYNPYAPGKQSSSQGQRGLSGGQTQRDLWRTIPLLGPESSFSFPGTSSGTPATAGGALPVDNRLEMGGTASKSTLELDFCPREELKYQPVGQKTFIPSNQGDLLPSSTTYPVSSASQEHRQTGVDNILTILTNYGLDQDDLDELLNYPEDQTTAKNLPHTLHKMRLKKATRAASSVQTDSTTSVSGLNRSISSEQRGRFQFEMPKTIEPSNLTGPSGRHDALSEDKIGDYICHTAMTENLFLSDSFKSSSHRKEVPQTVLPELDSSGLVPSNDQLGSVASVTLMRNVVAPSNSDPATRQSTLNQTLQTNFTALSLPNKHQDMTMLKFEVFRYVSDSVPSEEPIHPFAAKSPPTSSLDQDVNSGQSGPVQMDSNDESCANGQRETQEKGSKVVEPMIDPQTQKPVEKLSVLQMWQIMTSTAKPDPPSSFTPAVSAASHPALSSASVFDDTPPSQPVPDLANTTCVPCSKQHSPATNPPSKRLPSLHLMYDYAAATPKVFPHTCSLCKKECAQMKDWIVHQNTSLHLESCKQLRKKYPEWDGKLPVLQSPAVKSAKTSPSTARTTQHHRQRTSHSRSSSHSPRPRSSSDKKDKSSSGSRSPSRSPRRLNSRKRRIKSRSRSRSRPYSPRRRRPSHRRKGSNNSSRSCSHSRRSRPRCYSPRRDRSTSSCYSSRSNSHEKSTSPKRKYRRVLSPRRSPERRLSWRRSNKQQSSPRSRERRSSPRRSRDRRLSPRRSPNRRSSPRRSLDRSSSSRRSLDRSSSPRRSPKRCSSPRRSQDRSSSPRRSPKRRSSPRRSPKRRSSPRRSPKRRSSPRRSQDRSSSPRRSPKRRLSPRRSRKKLSSPGSDKRLSPTRSRECQSAPRKSDGMLGSPTWRPERQPSSRTTDDKQRSPTSSCKQQLLPKGGDEKRSLPKNGSKKLLSVTRSCKRRASEEEPSSQRKKSCSVQRLTKQILENPVVQSLAKQPNIKEIFELVVPVVIAELSKDGASSPSSSSSSVTSQGKKRRVCSSSSSSKAAKVQPKLQTSKASLSTKLKATVCFERKEDAEKLRHVRSLDVKGVALTVLPEKGSESERALPAAKDQKQPSQQKSAATDKSGSAGNLVLLPIKTLLSLPGKHKKASAGKLRKKAKVAGSKEKGVSLSVKKAEGEKASGSKKLRSAKSSPGSGCSKQKPATKVTKKRSEDSVVRLKKTTKVKKASGVVAASPGKGRRIVIRAKSRALKTLKGFRAKDFTEKTMKSSISLTEGTFKARNSDSKVQESAVEPGGSAEVCETRIITASERQLQVELKVDPETRKEKEAETLELEGSAESKEGTPASADGRTPAGEDVTEPKKSLTQHPQATPETSVTDAPRVQPSTAQNRNSGAPKPKAGTKTEQDPTAGSPAGSSAGIPAGAAVEGAETKPNHKDSVATKTQKNRALEPLDSVGAAGSSQTKPDMKPETRSETPPAAATAAGTALTVGERIYWYCGPQKINCVIAESILSSGPFTVDSTLLLITNLPDFESKSYTEAEVVNLLSKFGFKYEHDSIYVIPQLSTAFALMPNERSMLDLIRASVHECLVLRKRNLFLHIVKENLLMTPLGFYKSLMKLTPLSVNQDGTSLIYIRDISPSEADDLREALRKIGFVRNFLPLLNKVFIEFESVYDADRLGVWYSFLKKGFYHIVDRIKPPRSTKRAKPPQLPRNALPDSEAVIPGSDVPKAEYGIPQGTTSPFWITMTTNPYVFPTASPWFNIPDFLTVQRKDILTALHPGSVYSTVMLTGLPEGNYKHEDVARLVWPYFPQQNLQALYYNVLVLPLQRRAFVYFYDREACCSFVRDHVKKPFSVGSSALQVHFILQDMRHEPSEEVMYRTFMKWSNAHVPELQFLEKRLLCVELSETSMDLVKRVMEEVASLGCFVNFLPLANRICIEMVGSSCVSNVLEEVSLRRDLSAHKTWSKVRHVESLKLLKQRLKDAGEITINLDGDVSQLSELSNEKSAVPEAAAAAPEERAVEPSGVSEPQHEPEGAAGRSSVSKEPPDVPKTEIEPKAKPAGPPDVCKSEMRPEKRTSEPFIASKADLKPERRASDPRIVSKSGATPENQPVEPPNGSESERGDLESPDVSGSDIRSTTKPPDVSRSEIKSTAKPPDVSKSAVKSTTKPPDVSTTQIKSTTKPPDVSTQINPTKPPDVSVSQIKSTTKPPDVSGPQAKLEDISPEPSPAVLASKAETSTVSSCPPCRETSAAASSAVSKPSPASTELSGPAETAPPAAGQTEDSSQTVGERMESLLLPQNICCLENRIIMSKKQRFSIQLRLLLITNLPKYHDGCYTEANLARLLCRFGFHYDDRNIYVVPQARMAFVLMQNYWSAREVFKSSVKNQLCLKGSHLRVNIVSSRIFMSPFGFYKSLMELIQYEVTDDGASTIYVQNVSPSEARSLRDALRKIECVKNYFPLLGKVFIEFESIRDADRFGVWYSLLKRCPAHNIYRMKMPRSASLALAPRLAAKALPDTEDLIAAAVVPTTNFGVPKGSTPPFSVTMTTYPFVFPTASPWFIIPNFITVQKTTREWMSFRATRVATVMLTGLPEGNYKHEDVVKLVWRFLPRHDLRSLYYNVIVLPLQRRAFVYFNNRHLCYRFAEDYIKNPVSVRDSWLNVHLVLQKMHPGSSEDEMYRSLMKWSNSHVPELESLQERLVCVELSETSVQLIISVMKAVTGFAPVVSFLPLANRICIEMVEPSGVRKVVEKIPIFSFKDRSKVRRVESLKSLKQRLLDSSEITVNLDPDSGDVSFNPPAVKSDPPPAAGPGPRPAAGLGPGPGPEPRLAAGPGPLPAAGPGPRPAAGLSPGPGPEPRLAAGPGPLPAAGPGPLPAAGPGPRPAAGPGPQPAAGPGPGPGPEPRPAAGPGPGPRPAAGPGPPPAATQTPQTSNEETGPTAAKAVNASKPATSEEPAGASGKVLGFADGAAEARHETAGTVKVESKPLELMETSVTEHTGVKGSAETEEETSSFPTKTSQTSTAAVKTPTQRPQSGFRSQEASVKPSSEVQKTVKPNSDASQQQQQQQQAAGDADLAARKSPASKADNEAAGSAETEPKEQSAAAGSEAMASSTPVNALTITDKMIHFSSVKTILSQKIFSMEISLVVTNLPEFGGGCYTEADVVSLLRKSGFEFEDDKVFVVPQSQMAFVVHPAVKTVQKFFKASKSRDMILNGSKLCVRVTAIEKYGLFSFYKFLKSVSENTIIRKCVPSTVVYIRNISPSEATDLKDALSKIGGVINYIPLLNKVFVEFENPCDADRLGVWYSFLKRRLSHGIHRAALPGEEKLGKAQPPSLPAQALPHRNHMVAGAAIPTAECGVPEGTAAPFWLTMTTSPYVFPTACPWFNIPAHWTMREIRHKKLLKLKHFPTVMLTGLPAATYTHEDVAKLVWEYFPEQNLHSLYHNVMVLPLQRRAFVFFSSWDACFRFFQSHIRSRFCLKGYVLFAYFVLNMSPRSNEESMYRYLMELSNIHVPDLKSLADRLLCVEVSGTNERLVSEVMTEVASIATFASFLPLANRIYIEMAESSGVTKVVENLSVCNASKKSDVWNQVGRIEPLKSRKQRLQDCKRIAVNLELGTIDVYTKSTTVKGSAHPPLPLPPADDEEAPVSSAMEEDCETDAGTAEKKKEESVFCGPVPSEEEENLPNLDMESFSALKAAILHFKSTQSLTQSREVSGEGGSSSGAATDEDASQKKAGEDTEDVRSSNPHFDPDLNFEDFVTIDEISEDGGSSSTSNQIPGEKRGRQSSGVCSAEFSESSSSSSSKSTNSSSSPSSASVSEPSKPQTKPSSSVRGSKPSSSSSSSESVDTLRAQSSFKTRSSSSSSGEKANATESAGRRSLRSAKAIESKVETLSEMDPEQKLELIHRTWSLETEDETLREAKKCEENKTEEDGDTKDQILDSFSEKNEEENQETQTPGPEKDQVPHPGGPQVSDGVHEHETCRETRVDASVKVKDDAAGDEAAPNQEEKHLVKGEGSAVKPDQAARSRTEDGDTVPVTSLRRSTRGAKNKQKTAQDKEPTVMTRSTRGRKELKTETEKDSESETPRRTRRTPGRGGQERNKRKDTPEDFRDKDAAARRTRGRTRKTIGPTPGLNKRRMELSEPEAKRPRPQCPRCVPAGFNLPPLDPKPPLGEEFASPESGFFCDLCSVSSATEERHRRSRTHAVNLQNRDSKRRRAENSSD
ncbi:uncharacterized protein LOC108248598 isoform X2 [Kryptolebias marmoratus]|uniref:uncharacterized protein LOC108248598 isoform X2 n=1 Tax=Kryptolebias marmoratus TaxID=37003 RepID=UPI0018ACCB9A|nr:uncharacterized protein LOC108248598 isoform X2 [Kryptolebias marmoratus]